jgi:Cu+-exporting ATPase
MMIGDGLNDSGALKQSDIGVAVTDSASNFTPGSDAILLADKLDKLSDFILLAKKSVQTVYVSFFISVFYNIIGLIFAVQGILSPFIAAIFMPVSSISIMLFAVLSIKYFANKYKLNQL